MKIHHIAGKGDVVAVCDRELLNTTVRGGVFEVHISEQFYGTQSADDGAVRDALKFASNANLMGTRAISVAQEMGLIDAGGCIMIGDIPHAQIYRI